MVNAATTIVICVRNGEGIMGKTLPSGDDLYYRLNAHMAILVPPLRERREAIPACRRPFPLYSSISNRYLFGKDGKFVSLRRPGRSVQPISGLATSASSWPRDQEASAVLMTDGDRIDVDDLPFHHGDAADEATDISVDADAATRCTRSG